MEIKLIDVSDIYGRRLNTLKRLMMRFYYKNY